MDKISISLPAQAWNIVLNALGQRPYVEVAELLVEIKRQGDAAAKAKPEDSIDLELAQ
jgi:hypothetical protein